MRAADGESLMTAWYIISGLVALALLVYLFIALLRPEKFG
jgi:K+-transporting ATPase KdpF subunit